MSPLPFRWCAVFEQFGRLGQLGLISTLNIFRIKDCVVDSEAHLPAIRRSYKTVSFAPAVETVAETMAGIEPYELYVRDRDDARVGCEDELSVATPKKKAFRHALSPGAGWEDFQTFSSTISSPYWITLTPAKSTKSICMHLLNILSRWQR